MVGRTLLHYSIIDRLGSGGMGEVYLAKDQKLGRQVAIKVLPEAATGAVERFNAEARALAALNHPGIVTVYAVEEAEGQRFLVMERVEGFSLDHKLRPGGLPNSEFFQIAVPLAEAVAAAHERGILHRDLKPTNIMLTHEGRLKILDFGLAELMAPVTDVATTRTATELPSIVGTVPYMAPEALEGAGIDARTDLFALGVVFHELATGIRPFQGATVVEMMMAISKGRRASAVLEPSLPPQLAAVLDRCLAPLPADRYPSVQALVSDLKLLHSRTESTAALLAVRLSKARQRRRRGMVVAAIVALALGGGWAAWRFRPAPAAVATPDRKMIVVLPFENLGPPEDAFFAAGITEEITSRLASVRGLGVIARSSADQYQGSSKSIQEIGRELGVDYLVEGSVRWDRSISPSRVRVTPQLVRISDATHLWSERYDRVLDDLFTVQSEIAQQVISELNVEIFPAEAQRLSRRPTSNVDAYQAYLRGLDRSWVVFTPEQADSAEQALERAVQLDPNFALAFSELATMHSRVYHWGLDRSDARLAKAKAALDRALELAPDAGETHLAYGYYLYWGQRDYEGALRELDLAEKELPNAAALHEARAYVLRRQGNVQAGFESLREAVRLNPRDGWYQRELGVSALFLRRYDAALQAFDRAIETSPDPTLAVVSKVRCYWLMGDLAAARRTLNAAPAFKDDYPRSFRFWQAYFEGRPDEALQVLEGIAQPVVLWSAVYQPVDLMKGFALEQKGDRVAARQAFEAARQLLEAELGKNPDDARISASLGLTLAKLGDAAAAREAFRQANAAAPVEKDLLSGIEVLAAEALGLTLLGELEPAREIYQRLQTIPSLLSPQLLTIDPRWAELRQQLESANRG